jgi:hypothetical protein
MFKLFLATAAVVGLFVGGPINNPAAGKKAPTVTTESACPLIYAPVICDKGRIYPNQCVADQHHAKNCQPYTQGL